MPSASNSARDDALQIVHTLRGAGHIAYFAGGCVRDQLLGLQPKDYDVATDAPPDRVRELFRKTQHVGAAFGVTLVRQGRSTTEVATFRTDVNYTDGRRPDSVRFTTPQEDAQRRDFTINGLFFDPIENNVIDYVGGQNDLRTKTLRAIGEPDTRFKEDHLRLLRAIRFAARFDLTIEPNTTAAIRAHAEHLKRISPERIAEELRLMLTPPTRIAAWRALWDFCLIHVIFRTLPERPQTPLPVERYASPLFPQLAPGEPVSFGLALAALTLDFRAAGHADHAILLLLFDREVGGSVQACRTTLKISNDESDLMQECLALAPLLLPDPPTVACMKRFLAKPSSSEARRMLAAIAGADSINRPRIQWLAKQFAALELGDVAPPPLITGDDLTAAGLAPGPVFKRVLDQVYDAQLEDRVTTKEAALAMAMDLARHS
jgi:poly(A) polymerase